MEQSNAADGRPLPFLPPTLARLNLSRVEQHTPRQPARSHPFYHSGVTAARHSPFLGTPVNVGTPSLVNVGTPVNERTPLHHAGASTLSVSNAHLTGDFPVVSERYSMKEGPFRSVSSLPSTPIRSPMPHDHHLGGTPAPLASALKSAASDLCLNVTSVGTPNVTDNLSILNNATHTPPNVCNNGAVTPTGTPEYSRNGNNLSEASLMTPSSLVVPRRLFSGSTLRHRGGRSSHGSPELLRRTESIADLETSLTACTSRNLLSDFDNADDFSDND